MFGNMLNRDGEKEKQYVNGGPVRCGSDFRIRGAI